MSQQRFPKPPGQSALRKGRVSIPGHAYVITTVTKDRRPLFTDFILARMVISNLRGLHKTGAVDSLAFVLMPDHLHWLFTLGETLDLAEVVRRLKGSSARAIQRLGVSLVWQPGYYDHGIRGDEDLRAAARYLVANPLRAGLVENLGDYPLWDAVWLDSSLDS